MSIICGKAYFDRPQQNRIEAQLESVAKDIKNSNSNYDSSKQNYPKQ